MSDDLVGTLRRDLVPELRKLQLHEPWGRLVNEAADEIECLRKQVIIEHEEVEHLRESHQKILAVAHEANNHLGRYITMYTEAQIEIERLQKTCDANIRRLRETLVGHVHGVGGAVDGDPWPHPNIPHKQPEPWSTPQTESHPTPSRGQALNCEPAEPAAAEPWRDVLKRQGKLYHAQTNKLFEAVNRINRIKDARK